jgi:beta-xylosidase
LQGIDPSLFFDDAGRAYIQGSWRDGVLAETVCTIRQFEVKIDTGKRLSETVEIWKGFAGNVDAEGPHIYKKDGYYFLITAEAGTFEHHMICVARSTNIWGPYEPYENNPILTAFGKETLIQNTGHGELFKDRHGFWWCVCLGVRNNGGRYPLGRETFLAPVTWPKDGWPAIKNPTASFHREQDAVPSASESVFPTLKVGPRVDFVYIRDPNFEDYHFSNDNRKITLTPRNPTLSTQIGTTSFVWKRLRSLNSAAKVTLNIDEEARGKSIHALLSLYKDDIRHADIYYHFSKSNVCFSKELKLKGELVIIQKALVSPSAVTFRVGAEPQQYKFEYREKEEQEWKCLGSMDTVEMTGLDFTGPIFGVFASTRDAGAGPPVVFNDFEII